METTRQRVLLYGNSLVLSGIQANLKTCTDMEVFVLDELPTESELLTLNPSVAIFDMGTLQGDFFIAQMQALPDLLLIGVDVERHEVLLTGHAACSITLDQVTQFVRSWVRSGAVSRFPPTAAAA